MLEKKKPVGPNSPQKIDISDGTTSFSKELAPLNDNLALLLVSTKLFRFGYKGRSSRP